MLVDDLIEWRNVVIATSGSSVGFIHRFGLYREIEMYGVPYSVHTGRIYKDNQFIKYI